MILRVAFPLALLAAVATGPTAANVFAAEPAELETFAKNFAQLRAALIQLQQKVDDTTATIARNATTTYAKQQADELKASIGKLLASVADNGPLAVAGQLAVSYVREQLAAIQRDSRFTSSQRERLAREWTHILLKMSTAVGELTNARTEFLELLRLLQTNDDYLLELEKLRLAEETVDAINRLTAELRDASVRLRDLTSRMQASGV